MVNRIPKGNIVRGTKRVVPAGDPLIDVYDPAEIIVTGESLDYDGVRKAFPVAGGFLIGGPGDGGTGPTGPSGPSGPSGPERPDVPELSDIEVVLNTTYFDEVQKERGKIVLKVRNSAKNKSDVSGVDARIYQPKGI